jgi:hypothetical protein
MGFLTFNDDLSLGFKALHNTEHWTSGTNAECESKPSWCSLGSKITNRNMTWSNDGKGNCVSVKYGNASSFGKRECGEKMNYICEV